MPQIAYCTDPRGWMIGTSLSRDKDGEYRWWHFGPLALCWG